MVPFRKEGERVFGGNGAGVVCGHTELQMPLDTGKETVELRGTWVGHRVIT